VATGLITCDNIDFGENHVHEFYDTEKREGEKVEIYTEGIIPCSLDRILDL
jgi:hypothetical protein